LGSKTIAEAFAPASVANLGVGFDILGLAVAGVGDIVRAELRDEPGAIMRTITGDGGALTFDPARNTASVAANHVLQRIGASQGVALTLEKNLPLASGLGSSAASAVAAALAVNLLFGEPLRRDELLPCCLEGEAVVSGYHADNVAPSLLGGIVLVMGTDAYQIRHLPVPENLHLALMTPDVPVPTSEARSVLPPLIPFQTMVAQTMAVAGLIDALYRGDLEAAAAAMEADRVVEPARAHLMPLLVESRVAARRVGALGLVISGAGPTLCAVCDSIEIARCAAETLQSLFDEAGIGGVSRYTQVDVTGARQVQR